MIVLLVVGVNLLGDGLRDRPRRDEGSRHDAPDATTVLLEVRDLQIELMTDAGIVRAVDGSASTSTRARPSPSSASPGSGKSTTAMGILRLLPDDLAVLVRHGRSSTART